MNSKQEIDPLNSDDDISDEDPDELFGTENVVVCQYDKVSVCVSTVESALGCSYLITTNTLIRTLRNMTFDPYYMISTLYRF